MLQTADGTASAGSDYTALSGDEAMVTFSAGATGAALSQTVSVAITDDDLDENDEMFTVSLGGLPSGVGGGGTVTVTITDDDTPTVSFTGAGGADGSRDGGHGGADGGVGYRSGNDAQHPGHDQMTARRRWGRTT